VEDIVGPKLFKLAIESSMGEGV